MPGRPWNLQVGYFSPPLVPVGPVLQTMSRPRALLPCTHNSARGQMADGLLRAFGGDRFEVVSAGMQATSLRPLAVQAKSGAGHAARLHRGRAAPTGSRGP